MGLSSHMRRIAQRHTSPLLAFVALATMAAPALAEKIKAPPPARDALQYPDVDNHPREHVAIAVDPYTTKEQAEIFHTDYAKYNILPIRVIVTNNGDKPISLADARIDFVTAAGDKVPAAEPEDVERKLSRPTDVKKDIRIGPIPLRKYKSKDKDIEDDFSKYEYAALAVEPHTTRAGFLFYDLESVNDPLKGAHLELRKLRDSTGHEMFAFEVPFHQAAPASKK